MQYIRNLDIVLSRIIYSGALGLMKRWVYKPIRHLGFRYRF